MSGSVTSIVRKAGSAGEPDGLERVVLQFGDHVLRGFADRRVWEQQVEEAGAPEQLRFRAQGSESFEVVSLRGLKAAFFVKRFDGPGLDEIRFHDDLQPQPNLWVRVAFADGEVIEGLVGNGAAHVLQTGFFLTPTDPEANHSLIYVAKEQMREFQVLGLRADVKA